MRYNTTLHDLVKIGPFDTICPPSEHFLKEALKTWPCILYYLATFNNRGEFWRMRCSKQYSALAQVITCINVGLRNNLNTVISKSIGTRGKHNQIWK